MSMQIKLRIQVFFSSLVSSPSVLPTLHLRVSHFALSIKEKRGQQIMRYIGASTEKKRKTKKERCIESLYKIN